MKICLVGFMGSGKSVFGQELAAQLAFDFADTDKLIEESTGMKIPDIFSTHGEEFFRDSEKTVLSETLLKDNIVISTGGGLPVYFDNMEQMLRKSVTVFLKPSINELYERLKNDRLLRPLLMSIPEEKLMEHIQALYSLRLPYYKKAQLVISPTQMTAKFLAGYLLKG